MLSAENSNTKTFIAFLVVLVAFAWIGYAYIVGAQPDKMILHPIVPILLILLLLGFKGDDSLRRTIIIAITFICVWIFVRLQSVFIPFVVGFAFAYVVYVALMGLQNIPIPLGKGRKFRLPRRAAIAILIFLLIAIVAFFVLGIVPQLMKQGGQMKDGISNFYTKIKDYTTKMVADIEEGHYPFEDKLPESWEPVIIDVIDKISAYVQEKIPAAATMASEILGNLLARLSAGILGTIGQVSSAFFIIIVFIYAIESFQSHTQKVKDMIPASYRDAAIRYAIEIDINMRAFLKGQLAVIVIISIISAIIYSIIRIPFALLVGLLAGLCNAIPTIGPILGGIIAGLATLIGFVASEYALTGFLIRLAFVIGAVFGIQLLDNSLISPKIMSSALDVHPLVILFAVLLAASLVGIWGAVLAIPGIVVCKAFIKVSREMKAERGAREMQEV